MNHIRALLLLSLLAAFPPMSTDMYLPALPTLQALWHTDTATINLTLILFFVFFSVALLIYGPLSDSFGRRPLLLGGIGVYMAASVVCGLADSVHSLILFRIFQALGAASAASLTMAIAKDLFETNERQQLLAYLGVIVALAPMLAPMLGGLIIKWLSWQWVFYIQALWGLIAFGGVLRMPEPLKTKIPATIKQLLGRYVRLLKNGRYLTMTLLMSMSMTPLFAFIAGSPSIYMSHFRLDAQHFGFYFGANAFALMCGSFLCGWLTRRVKGWLLLRIGFVGMVVGGTAIGFIGGLGPMAFAAAMFTVTFCMGLTRPMSNNLVLEQVEEDVGTAAALLMFVHFVAGAAGMALISQTWSDRIGIIALLSSGCGLAILVGLYIMVVYSKSALKAVQ